MRMGLPPRLPTPPATPPPEFTPINSTKSPPKNRGFGQILDLVIISDT